MEVTGASAREIITSAPQNPPPTVLIVEDHTDVRSLLRLLLEEAGLVCAGEAPSGEEALRMALTADVAVIDANLPGMDGFELAAELRALQPGIAVVLCSGVVDSEVQAAAATAGIAACVSKDDFAGLAAVVTQVARKNSGSGSTPGRTSSSR